MEFRKINASSEVSGFVDDANIDSFGVSASDVDDCGDENDVSDDSGGGGVATWPSEPSRLLGRASGSGGLEGERLRVGLRQAIDDLSSSRPCGSVEKGRKLGLVAASAALSAASAPATLASLQSLGLSSLSNGSL
jgi:hypothetical protein